MEGGYITGCFCWTLDKLVYGGYNLGGWRGYITGCFCWTADKLVYGGLQSGREGGI